MQILQINHAEYAYSIHRQNSSLPFLLMLHGFMGDGRSFGHLLKPMSQFCNPVTLDLLGHGKSEKVEDYDRYREKQQVADLQKIMGYLFDKPPFLYGYSMGGRLALKTASGEPGLVKGLILESTNPGIEDDEKRSERKATDLQRAKKIEKNYLKFLDHWETLPLFESTVPQDVKQADAYKQMHQQQEPKAMAASLKGFGTGFMKPITGDHQQYEGPVMLLAGTEDHKYVTSNKDMEGLFKQVSNQIIPGGHRVHLDNPEKFIQHVISFIEQHT